MSSLTLPSSLSPESTAVKKLLPFLLAVPVILVVGSFSEESAPESTTTSTSSQATHSDTPVESHDVDHDPQPQGFVDTSFNDFQEPTNDAPVIVEQEAPAPEFVEQPIPAAFEEAPAPIVEEPPAPVYVEQAPAPAAPSAYYPNCAAARAAGAAPLYAGSPGYSTSLDRDRDGVACE